MLAPCYATSLLPRLLEAQKWHCHHRHNYHHRRHPRFHRQSPPQQNRALLNPSPKFRRDICSKDVVSQIGILREWRPCSRIRPISILPISFSILRGHVRSSKDTVNLLKKRKHICNAGVITIKLIDRTVFNQTLSTSTRSQC